MYGYFDESIISIGEKKYVTIGAIFCELECKENVINKKVKIFYDKSIYKVKIDTLKSRYVFLKSFEMKDSKRSFGIQHADWIVGEGSDDLRKIKQAH